LEALAVPFGRRRPSFSGPSRAAKTAAHVAAHAESLAATPAAGNSDAESEYPDLAPEAVSDFRAIARV
jgi:plasmid stabilization system protein ParE